jgi:hypothetical protein
MPAERDVLSSLPRTRPTRRSAKRAAPADEPPAATAAGTGGNAPTKKPRPPATPKPKADREPAAATVEPERASFPPPPPAGWAVPHEDEHQGGTIELLATTVQAVGELAEIGLTYTGQVLRQALSRLPRP